MHNFFRDNFSKVVAVVVVDDDICLCRVERKWQTHSCTHRRQYRIIYSRFSHSKFDSIFAFASRKFLKSD